MSYNCTCLNKTTGKVAQPSIIISSCVECSTRCGENETTVCEARNSSSSLDVEGFLIILLVQIVLFFVMLSFSIAVLSKLRWKPMWLVILVAALLLAWIAIGWYPGVGLGIFLVLSILLIVFYQKSSKKVTKKKLSKQYFV